MTQEIWKDVLGYEGLYQVSSLGNLKALARERRHVSGGVRRMPERMLQPIVARTGYWRNTLSDRTGKVFHVFTHRLICAAFHGPKIGDLYVNHKDGNRLNNNAENLEWVTRSQNQCHARDVLGKFRGPKPHAAKLTIEQVEIARGLSALGMSNRKLGFLFRVDTNTIRSVVLRLTWKHAA